MHIVAVIGYIFIGGQFSGLSLNKQHLFYTDLLTCGSGSAGTFSGEAGQAGPGQSDLLTDN